MAGRNRGPPEKRGYVIAKDLKAAGPLVPQLQEAGSVKWAAGFADVMQWQDSLLDLLREGYDFENEDEAGEMFAAITSRTVPCFFFNKDQ